MSARLVGNDGIAPDHRLPGGSFLLQVSGEEPRRVEHRDQGLVLELLVPAEPKESLPGSRLPSATSSASVLAGTEGWTQITSGATTPRATGTKSRSALYARFL